ncbi:MAG: hypothetical protein AB7J28_13270 [Hyphomonadaceae bacterium]
MPHKTIAILALAALAACGPSYAPPNAPSRACPTITAAEYQSALDAGAARGRARVHASGMVELNNGPGVVHCATYSSGMRPCRRPNDYVIEYTLADGSVTHVRVPANAQYRFNVHRTPTHCEIVNENGPGQAQ